MVDDDGFCGACRALEHAPAGGDGTAECGHRTHFAAMRWCAACAITKGVCRKCGVIVRTRTPPERPGSSEDP